MDARHLKAATSAMPVKTDRIDARNGHIFENQWLAKQRVLDPSSLSSGNPSAVEVAKDCDLSLVDLAFSLGEVAPSGAVNLRKLPDVARAGWPLHWEPVALNDGKIDVRFDCPNVDQLA